MRISLSVLAQLLLKYAYMLDILIHQFVHMEFSDGILLIFLNFEKTIWLQKIWMKLNHTSFTKLFFKSLEESWQSAIRKFHVDSNLMNQNV